MVINRKERFATEGIRFQRHNGDGTIPTPQRFLGFANTVDLSKFGTRAALTIKIDNEKAETKTISFEDVTNIRRVTVDEAVNALNEADFPDIVFSVDDFTGRLKGAYSSGTQAKITIELKNVAGADVSILPGTYSLIIQGQTLLCEIDTPIIVEEDDSIELNFTAYNVGVLNNLPIVNADVELTDIVPNFDVDQFEGIYKTVKNGTAPAFNAKKIQVVGELAAALDFGNCIKHGGRGLEIISFFNDEVISIGLPKDIKDKEEIDIEGAKGTITRMVVGAMLQGLSPVVALKEKDYYLLQLIQGGRLDVATGTYDPPLSNENDQPTFYAEIFSAVYSSGSNKVSDVAGYEKILLRSMTGIESDVPIEAKSWAQYAFNLIATEYTDEFDKKYPAWQEQSMSLEDFDALKVKELKIL